MREDEMNEEENEGRWGEVDKEEKEEEVEEWGGGMKEEEVNFKHIFFKIKCRIN